MAVVTACHHQPVPGTLHRCRGTAYVQLTYNKLCWFATQLCRKSTKLGCRSLSCRTTFARQKSSSNSRGSRISNRRPPLQPAATAVMAAGSVSCLAASLAKAAAAEVTRNVSSPQHKRPGELLRRGLLRFDRSWEPHPLPLLPHKACMYMAVWAAANRC